MRGGIERQALLWIPEAIDRKDGSAPRAPPVPFTDAPPDQVWTLYGHRDEARLPSLPFCPVHHRNDFAEDYVHDWTVFRETFRYGSRALDGGVWLLLEYRTKESRRRG